MQDELMNILDTRSSSGILLAAQQCLALLCALQGRNSEALDALSTALDVSLGQMRGHLFNDGAAVSRDINPREELDRVCYKTHCVRLDL